MGLELSEDE